MRKILITLPKKYRQFVWILPLVLALLAGVSMWQRTQQQLLWGYRPLLLFVGLWAAWALWRWQRNGTDAHRNQQLLALTLTGLLLGLGFPGWLAFPFLLFIAWIPLLYWQDQLQQRGASRWQWAYTVYPALLLWNILSTYWVTNTALVAGVAAIGMNSLLMALPLLLFDGIRRVTPRLGYAAWIVAWLSFEYIHLRWELTWPWLTLGNGFAQYPTLVQWYEWTGHLGGSLWILVVNWLVWQAWQHYRAGQRRWLVLGWRLALVLLLPMVGSLVRYSTYDLAAGVGKIRVAVLQPNYEPHYQKFVISDREQVARLAQLSLEALRADSTLQYLVYPETSFGFPEERAVGDDPLVGYLREQLDAYPQVKIVTGVNMYHRLTPDEPLTPHVRQQRDGSGQVTMNYEVMNAAAQIEVGSGEVQTYRKSKLVPGPEIFPYSGLFFFLKPIIDKLDGTTAGLATQPERSNFVSASGSVAPVICYESVFGEYFTGYVRAGAQAAFIMTNDGWWDNTAGYRQHLWFASLRAIETRRAICRSANTGSSAFLNARGDITQRTAYNQVAVLTDDMALHDHITFYSQWGDLLARIALFTCLLFVLNALVKSRVQR